MKRNNFALAEDQRFVGSVVDAVAVGDSGPGGVVAAAAAVAVAVAVAVAAVGLAAVVAEEQTIAVAVDDAQSAVA